MQIYEYFKRFQIFIRLSVWKSSIATAALLLFAPALGLEQIGRSALCVPRMGIHCYKGKDDS
jgi:hypothetical protein